MQWSEERKRQFGQAQRERFKALPVEIRRARSEAGREASRRAALQRKHERYALELREHGWITYSPVDICELGTDVQSDAGDTERPA